MVETTDSIKPVDRPAPSLGATASKKMAQVFGFVWSLTIFFPSKFYDLIKKISMIVREHFTTPPPVSIKSDISASVVDASTPVEVKADAIFNREVAEEEYIDMEALFGSREKVEKPLLDPLSAMGGFSPESSIPAQRALSDSFDLFDEEFEGIVKEAIEPAQNLLKKLKSKKRKYDFLEMSSRLSHEHQSLRAFASSIEESPVHQQTVQKTIDKIEDQILKLAKSELQDLDEPFEISDYLKTLDHLDQILEPLKCNPGKASIQKMIIAIEKKQSSIQKDLCDNVYYSFKPNPDIPDIGNCMYDSISEELGGIKSQNYYRKLAVDYIRKNKEDEEVIFGVEDAMSTLQAQSSMLRYAKEQSGLKVEASEQEHMDAWAAKLERKLKHAVTPLDLYCDCMENYTFWGGTNELFALSETLKVPILVFTSFAKSPWKLAFAFGQLKYQDKTPLLLYYNGINHYQNLIEK